MRDAKALHIAVEEADLLGAGEEMPGHLVRCARRDGDDGAEEIGLEQIAGGRSETCIHPGLLIWDDRSQPVFFGNAEPAASGGVALWALVLQLFIFDFAVAQRAVHHTDRADVHIEAGLFRTLALSRHKTPALHIDRCRAGVGHPLPHREHEILVDGDDLFKHHAGGVGVAQRHRRFGGEARAAGGP